MTVTVTTTREEKGAVNEIEDRFIPFPAENVSQADVINETAAVHVNENDTRRPPEQHSLAMPENCTSILYDTDDEELREGLIPHGGGDGALHVDLAVLAKRQSALLTWERMLGITAICGRLPFSAE